MLICESIGTVAASTRQGAETSYTNIGAGIALSAPGGEMPTLAAGLVSTSDGGVDMPLDDSTYVPTNGTSFAAPVVTGVAALMLSIEDLTAFQVEATLRDTARAFPTGTNDGFRDCSAVNCGAGLVDATAAIAAVEAGIIPGVWPGGTRLAVVGDNSKRSRVSVPSLVLLSVLIVLRRQRRAGGAARVPAGS